jgi:hypothetical protein
MNKHDDRAPSPTDPPLDGIPGDMAPNTETENGAETLADTEGHSMFNPELSRTIVREHVREADRIARDSARVREAKKGGEGGFLKRFSRR